MKPRDKTGTKKKPDNLKLLQGTYRKDRASNDGVDIPIDTPKAPRFLSGYAVEEWDRITEQLHLAGLLTQVDMAILAAYCQAYGRWASAEEQLGKSESNVTTSSGEVIKSSLILETMNGNIIQNPLVGAANKAMELMIKCAVEFGMSPSSRGKVSVKEKPKEKSKWEKRG